MPNGTHVEGPKPDDHVRRIDETEDVPMKMKAKMGNVEIGSGVGFVLVLGGSTMCWLLGGALVGANSWTLGRARSKAYIVKPFNSFFPEGADTKLCPSFSSAFNFERQALEHMRMNAIHVWASTRLRMGSLLHACGGEPGSEKRDLRGGKPEFEIHTVRLICT